MHCTHAPCIVHSALHRCTMSCALYTVHYSIGLHTCTHALRVMLYTHAPCTSYHIYMYVFTWGVRMLGRRWLLCFLPIGAGRRNILTAARVSSTASKPKGWGRSVATWVGMQVDRELGRKAVKPTCRLPSGVDISCNGSASTGQLVHVPIRASAGYV